MSNKFLGQHFLKNAAAVEKIVRAIAPAKGEVVFEIGAGHGELTLPLAERCAKNGAEIFAIEKDAELASSLVIPGGDANAVIHDDALAFFTSGAAAKKAAGRSYKIVGNIPYYLTGHLLRIVGELDTLPTRCVFMVQKEVAERAAAQPPKMNRLAASVQYWADPVIAGSVPKEDFYPVPKVDSAILVLEKKKSMANDPGAEHYYAAVRDLFAQPRKTIVNNLTVRDRKKEAVRDALAAIGIDPTLRPQNLAISSIAAIANAFSLR